MFGKLESILRLQDLGHDLCGLAGADVGTGENQIERETEFAQHPGNAAHFLVPLECEWPVAIFSVIKRAAFDGDAMAQDVDFFHKLFSFRRAFSLRSLKCCVGSNSNSLFAATR